MPANRVRNVLTLFPVTPPLGSVASKESTLVQIIQAKTLNFAVTPILVMILASSTRMPVHLAVSALDPEFVKIFSSRPLDSVILTLAKTPSIVQMYTLDTVLMGHKHLMARQLAIIVVDVPMKMSAKIFSTLTDLFVPTTRILLIMSTVSMTYIPTIVLLLHLSSIKLHVKLVASAVVRLDANPDIPSFFPE